MIKSKMVDALDNENDEQDKSDDVSSPKGVNDVGQHVNTASPDINTGSSKLNIVDPSVNIVGSNDQDSPQDRFIMGVSHKKNPHEATRDFSSSLEERIEPESDLRKHHKFPIQFPTTPVILIL
ncbi:hypothetical protein Tco_0363782 [Tanacetum coccineum]